MLMSQMSLLPPKGWCGMVTSAAQPQLEAPLGPGTAVGEETELMQRL